MSKAIIAIVCDFDETLGPDTVTFLLTENNISPEKFWQEVANLVKDSWDPPLAYMHQLFEYSKLGKIDLSQKALNSLGKKLPLFPGLPDGFLELKKISPNLELYIISGGLEDIILGTDLAKYVNGIFGSSFAYNKGKPLGIKTAISFTEKTRYLYGIHKGIKASELRNDPYKINKVVPIAERRIPFSQMIYIGDGPSDIPCLSAISQYGGMGIGVSSPNTSFKRGYELARKKRITAGPYTANYKKGSDMRKVLEESILRIGLEIAENKGKH